MERLHGSYVREVIEKKKKLRQKLRASCWGFPTESSFPDIFPFKQIQSDDRHFKIITEKALVVIQLYK